MPTQVVVVVLIVVLIVLVQGFWKGNKKKFCRGARLLNHRTFQSILLPAATAVPTILARLAAVLAHATNPHEK
jgi:hypothetical protein